MIAAIIQARVGSTRLYNKVFADICGKPLIWHVVNRLTFSKRIDKIVLATTLNPLDDELESWARVNKVFCFRGSETDVLDRYLRAAIDCGATEIVRITADDPFKDPKIIDDVIDSMQQGKADFAYNNNPPSFPEGIDTEVFTFDALRKAAESSCDPFEREHVTQYFYRNSNLFKQHNLSYKINLSHLRWTIDTERDLDMAREVYRYLYKEGDIFLLEDILNLLEKAPEIANMNKEVKRSHMYIGSK